VLSVSVINEMKWATSVCGLVMARTPTVNPAPSTDRQIVDANIKISNSPVDRFMPETHH
jgi:hypothetical protein